MKRFAKSTARATTRFFISAISVLTCCISASPQEDEDASPAAMAEPRIPTSASTTYSSECNEVALSEDSYVLEILSRENPREDQRISVMEALHYEPDPASIHSISSQSLESIEELDITGLPLSVDEITMMRRHKQAEELAARLREQRNRKRKFFCALTSCFG